MALVLWSGGCDSTLVLLNLLKEHRAENKGWVTTVSFNHDNIAASKESRAARRSLQAWFKKERYLHLHSEVTISHSGYREVEKGDGLSQPAIWLTHALNYLKVEEDLYAGYIQSDDFWHRFDGFEMATKGLFQMIGKKGKVYFPLQWFSKAEVIKDLEKAKILNLCWYCESPKSGKPCGNCPPCRTHITAEFVNKKWP